MERIISSKGQKYSLVWCRALLREWRVSNHLPPKKSKRIQRCKNEHKKWSGDEWRRHEPCCRETFHGSCCSGGVAVLSVSLAAFPLCRTPSQWNPGPRQAIWASSVSATVRWPAGGLLARAFCRPLSLNSWTFLVDPYLLKQKSAADNEPKFAAMLPSPAQTMWQRW